MAEVIPNYIETAIMQIMDAVQRVGQETHTTGGEYAKYLMETAKAQFIKEVHQHARIQK